MKCWGVVLGFAVVITGNVVAHADEPNEGSSSSECDPQCRSGFSCREGTCVRAQCTPKCRSGFLCREGECVSMCNPPCSGQEQCTAEGECRSKPKLSDVRWTDKPHRKPKSEEGDDDGDAGRRKGERAEATVGRLYVGPEFLVASSASALVTSWGATLAFHASPVARSPFFVGVRVGGVGFTDGSGGLAAIDLEVGGRFTFHETRSSAAGLMLGAGTGGGVLWGSASNVPFLHVPAHIGPFFDVGGFTFEVVVGPSILYNKAALVAFESSIEFGVRF